MFYEIPSKTQTS